MSATRVSKQSKQQSRGTWTIAEDESLTKAVELHGAKNWKKIAELVPGRSDVQCLHRWQKVLNPELVKGPWTDEEDNKVRELVKIHGAKKWSVIASHLPGRIGKQCRERWTNHLDPHVKKGNWEEWEDDMIIKLQREVGNKWARIAKYLPGRTDNHVKNRFNSTISRRIRQEGVTKPSTKKKLKKSSAAISAIAASIKKDVVPDDDEDSEEFDEPDDEYSPRTKSPDEPEYEEDMLVKKEESKADDEEDDDANSQEEFTPQPASGRTRSRSRASQSINPRTNRLQATEMIAAPVRTPPHEPVSRLAPASPPVQSGTSYVFQTPHSFVPLVNNQNPLSPLRDLSPSRLLSVDSVEKAHESGSVTDHSLQDPYSFSDFAMCGTSFQSPSTPTSSFLFSPTGLSPVNGPNSAFTPTKLPRGSPPSILKKRKLSPASFCSPASKRARLSPPPIGSVPFSPSSFLNGSPSPRGVSQPNLDTPDLSSPLARIPTEAGVLSSDRDLHEVRLQSVRRQLNMDEVMVDRPSIAVKPQKDASTMCAMTDHASASPPVQTFGGFRLGEGMLSNHLRNINQKINNDSPHFGNSYNHTVKDKGHMTLEMMQRNDSKNRHLRIRAEQVLSPHSHVLQSGDHLSEDTRSGSNSFSQETDEEDSRGSNHIRCSGYDSPYSDSLGRKFGVVS